MLETVTSIGGVTIRLTDERWAHITDEHSELAGTRYEILETLMKPDRIYKGRGGEMLAVRAIELGKFLIVVYRESDADGFVITAFSARRMHSVEKTRELVWSART